VQRALLEVAAGREYSDLRSEIRGSTLARPLPCPRIAALSVRFGARWLAADLVRGLAVGFPPSALN